MLARDLVAELPTGTLVVADLGYFGFAWFDWLTDRGYYLSRLRAKATSVIHTFYHRGDVFDGSCGWEHTALIGQARRSPGDFQTGEPCAATSPSHDPRTRFHPSPRSDARRWDIETLVKQHLKLRLLWCCQAGGAPRRLIISQVLYEAPTRPGLTRSKYPFAGAVCTPAYRRQGHCDLRRTASFVAKNAHRHT